MFDHLNVQANLNELTSILPEIIRKPLNSFKVAQYYK